MQMLVVRLAGGEIVLELAPEDRIDGLEYWVDQQKQREPGRNFGIAQYEQDGKLGNQEPDQIGAAITKEDLPARPVPKSDFLIPTPNPSRFTEFADGTFRPVRPTHISFSRPSLDDGTVRR